MTANCWFSFLNFAGYQPMLCVEDEKITPDFPVIFFFVYFQPNFSSKMPQFLVFLCIKKSREIKRKNKFHEKPNLTKK